MRDSFDFCPKAHTMPNHILNLSKRATMSITRAISRKFQILYAYWVYSGKNTCFLWKLIRETLIRTFS